VAKADPLMQLKDIHLPEPVGFWPIAPGWYGLIILLLLGILGLTYFIQRQHKNARAKKQALQLLDSYKVQYEQDKNAQLMSSRISELLKQVALVYFPRSEVASLHGESWIEFLNNTSKGIDFNPVKLMLLEVPFKSTATLDLTPLIVKAAQWIKQRNTPCSN